MGARPLFDEELKHLNHEMIEMGEWVKEAIQGSYDAVCHNDKSMARSVAENDVRINKKERTIESICINLFLREQPVASDLRHVTAALKIITDLERIGDQAAEICEIVYSLPAGVDLTVFEPMNEMAKKALQQVESVIDSYVKLDGEKAHLCVENDKEINQLFELTKKDILNHIIEHKDDEGSMLEVLMIAKYLERIGDHVVNIAEWVEYAIDGIHKGTVLSGS